MSKGLDKQVYIYSVGTEAFYDDEEIKVHNKLSKLHINKSLIKNKIKKLDKEINKEDVPEEEKMKLITRKKKLQKGKKKSTEFINRYKTDLKVLLNNHVGVRELREDSLLDNKKIGMFDSALTRTIGMKIDSVSTNLLVVRVYYYQVLKELIEDGFMYQGEKYIYFSSSAGQIRTKKVVFIKESLWLKHEGALTCGLSIEEINEKGGCNVNKLLAYKALTASASQKWYGFDIDRTIVVPDLETNVTSMFDYIDRDTYEIERKEMSVPIEHTDGCGIILPKKSKKSFMVRLPYVKGLLAPFPFDEFAKQQNATKVTDIYGKEWDILEDDIHVIFTASQFKMKKYYDDWSDYKERFKKYNCQAVTLNEEDIGEDATLNYQMLQTLTDVSNKELKILAQPTADDILQVGSDKETMLRILGATKTNHYRNYYQEALLLYPEMLNDEHSKKIIKDKKKSMVRDARAGKLRITGKYTYLIPDLYAFCERLFLKSENPKGLLNNGETYCRIYNEGKLDILRSPHLYKEHCIRTNVLDEEKDKWFITSGIYTSIHDPISRILQFDNDGDKGLVIQHDLFVEIAERNMEGIVPLFYEMGAAKGEIITNTKIYDSLLLAFKANIGEVSNNITKVFNSDDIDLEVVKWLTAENNYVIDFAKTLYMPTRPESVDTRIKEYIKSKLPYFFMEAKEKESHKVEPLNNSTVNRLRKIIPNKTIRFEDVAGHFDYKVLMSKDISKIDEKIVKEYRKLDRSKKWIIRNNKMESRKEGTLFLYKYIRDELRNVCDDEDRIVNVLVKELYGRTDAKTKTTLWNCYGDILIMNLRGNLKGSKQCEECGERIQVINNQSKYCSICFEKVRKEYKRIKEREYRIRKRGQLDTV
jgi:hypothetical protein